jgi:hypothetical protein
MARRSGGHWRIEPVDELGELLEHAIVVVGMLTDEVDHLAIAVGRLSAVAPRLVHDSEVVPAVVHVGETDQQVAGGRLGLVELAAATSCTSELGEREHDTRRGASASSSLPAATGCTTALEVEPAGRLAERKEEHRRLIAGLWSKQAIGIVGGEPKCCKSFLDIAVAVAAGMPCLRCFAVPRTGRVLLCAAEDALHMTGSVFVMPDTPPRSCPLRAFAFVHGEPKMPPLSV